MRDQYLQTKPNQLGTDSTEKSRNLWINGLKDSSQNCRMLINIASVAKYFSFRFLRCGNNIKFPKMLNQTFGLKLL